MVIGTLLVGGAVLWAYWPVIGEMAGKWFNHPHYSHAFLVPTFSAYLLWRSRKEGRAGVPGPAWWGLLPLLVGAVLRVLGAVLYVSWLEMVSLLPVLWGIALLLGGWAGLRRSWVAIGFLGFMFPLPHRVENALSGPLQHLASWASAYALQSVGLPAFREGNVIIVQEHHIGVVEACNGLGMLLLFFALTAAIALLSRRPWPDRLVLLLSAVPIALVSNVVRIVLTGVLTILAGQRWADLVFHDLAGWLMMPLALGLVWLGLRVLSFLLVEVPVEEDLPAAIFPGARGGALQHAQG
jgi:exosortase